MSQRKILVVDDNKGTLRLLEKTLSAEGYDILQAQGGQEAIRKAAKEIPDMIIMDIVMPDMDGSEAVRILRDTPATESIPVLFLSSILDQGQKPEEQKVNVGGLLYDAVAKPFSHEEILARIKRILD